MQAGLELLKFTALYLGLLTLLGMAGALCGYHFCHMYVTTTTGLHLIYAWLPEAAWQLVIGHAHVMWSEVCGLALLAQASCNIAAGWIVP